MITRWRYCLNAVMITRWQYCLNAAMITRWHYCTSMDRPLIKKTGRRTTERERQMDRKRENVGGRMQCFMKNEYKSLIDVDKFDRFATTSGSQTHRQSN